MQWFKTFLIRHFGHLSKRNWVSASMSGETHALFIHDLWKNISVPLNIFSSVYIYRVENSVDRDQLASQKPLDLEIHFYCTSIYIFRTGRFLKKLPNRESGLIFSL